ncbi:Tim44 domain-containing protein [Chenggangzhangella methanolivorans]|uniref:TIM44-like domain-containing protein n=1 Tax=Chenggangzhangella methanolivorans TaxID=1437009 RepID=A0A9E6UIT2_9HYPH|nr:TIM44-like domain-containing protein [Chenggangzhangella methanolivorans]QZO01218.1 TIM44-like domain-containing protein [Chenggangzhangella methanolivorans]
MRHASVSIRRAFAVFAAVVLVGATLVPEDADARAGRSGSMGSRGSRTFDAAPPTATAPGAQQMQRSATQPGQPGGMQNNAAGRPAQAPGRGMFGGGLAAGLMGGLLGAGLFGLLSGSGLFGGLGSMASILGLIIQIGLIFLVVRLVMNWMRRRNEPQAASAGANAGASPYSASRPQPQSVSRDGASYGGGSYGSGSGGGFGFGQTSGQSADRGIDIELEPQDFEVFERMLSEVQEAWSNQDMARLRGLATPEMMEMFGNDLDEDASRGVINKVSGVKLLQGDLAESWREGSRDYATVAMRYELIDVTEEVSTGRVVEGNPSRTEEATELWTFVRVLNGGRWMLSAIQQSE